jgi:peptidoglycan/xylan/chitin deacetylase (PgdA/CDA1 family)
VSRALNVSIHGDINHENARDAMRTLLKSGLAYAYAAAGGLRRLHAGRTVILTFHRVRPGGVEPHRRAMRILDAAVPDFRRILAWMRDRYEPVALGDWVRRRSPPARASFAVTFDDGWADNYEHAFPVLRELGIPATIFLATGAVEDRTPFWWQMPGLTDTEIERLKMRAHPGIEARLAGLPELRKAHAGDFLTWDQVREMGRSGLVTFGPHGHRHALMDLLSREEAVEDIRKCWGLLKDRAPGALVPVFAWPNGNARDDLGADLDSLGLLAALGTGLGAAATADQARWNLPRNNVDRSVAATPGLLPWLLMRAR